jgi:phage gp29-like protein
MARSSNSSTILVDHLGRPITRQSVPVLQAEPGLVSIRQAWTQSVASGLTPQRLASILAACDTGDTRAFLALAEEMEERDPHYAAVLGKRKRAVSGVAPVVTAASEDAADQRLADEVRRAICDHTGFADLVEDLLDGLGKGWAAVEIGWDTKASPWKPARFLWRNPQWFLWDRESGQDLRLMDEADPVNGVALRPFGWITHRPRIKSGLPARGGLARLAAFSWMCKAYTLKDWIAFVEIYGLPLRLGRYGPEATKSDVEALMRAVSNIGTDAAAVLPRHMDITFEAGPGGADTRIFESLARWTDEQVSKAVLGETMSTDNGSSRAQATVHNEVRHDLALADARAVAATLNRDLVRPFIDLNWGVQKAYPILSIPVAAAEDVSALVTNAVALAGVGVRIKASELRARTGFSDPDPDDEVIGVLPAAAPPSAAPPRTGTASNRQAADADDGPNPVLDEVEYEALKDWQAQMDGTLDPVIEVIQAAGSYEEAREALALVFPKLDASRLVAGLVTATTKARGHGDATDA